MGATAAGAARVRRGTRRAAAALGGSRTARLAARGGLVARSVFYLLLAYLTARVAADHGRSGRQANAHGALGVIASDPLGMAAIAATALGFLALGAVRIAGAVRDREASLWRRVTTALQGLFYVVLTYVPASFLLGRRTTGSEQQQHAQTARLLALPGGRELLVAAGTVVVVVCGWQIRSALTTDFADGMRLERAPAWVCRLVAAAGLVGITARALVYMPVGVFLVVAAVQADPAHASGLDHELASLAGRSWWGPLVLALVAFGLVVFAGYSLLEARYRNVAEGE